MNERQCSNCLNLTANDFHICGVCQAVQSRLQDIHLMSDSPESIIADLRSKYTNKTYPYDVCIGISGGVDSCMVATLAGEAGLRVKLVHFDNGWNTNKANKNIFSICDKYNFDLDTRIMDWEIFKSLQRSFLYASVPDIELVTDHAIFSTMTKELAKKEAPVFLNGANFSTEHGLNLGDLVWSKLDILNIRSINKAYENVSLKSYPSSNPFIWAKYRFINKKSRVDLPLNDYWYKRNVAINYMKEKFNFEDYGFKHEESIFTKVYQRVILKDKFNCIKVLPHINSQIRNKELTKQEGMLELENFTKNSGLEKYEVEFVREKLDFEKNEWDMILNTAPRCHSEFMNMGSMMKPIMAVMSRLKLRAMD